MTQENQAATSQEHTSRILDGDIQVNDQTLAQLDEKKFSRYAMIGDVMRHEGKPSVNIDITAQVAAALEDEPTYNLKPVQPEQPETKPDNVVQISAWRRPLSQIAIAASVALVAVIGVNTMPTQPVQTSDLPVLQSTPLAGGVAPVSFSNERTALQSAEQGLRERQQQRIGALVLEHQRQSRMAHALQQAKQSQTDNKE